MNMHYACIALEHNNFCLNIGRSHLSNKIYIVVDKIHCQFRQKCRDPDCKSFASEWFPIPCDVDVDSEDDIIRNVALPSSATSSDDEMLRALPLPAVQEPSVSVGDNANQSGLSELNLSVNSDSEDEHLRNLP